MEIALTEIEIIPVKPHNGLLAFASFVLTDGVSAAMITTTYAPATRLAKTDVSIHFVLITSFLPGAPRRSKAARGYPLLSIAIDSGKLRFASLFLSRIHHFLA